MKISLTLVLLHDPITCRAVNCSLSAVKGCLSLFSFCLSVCVPRPVHRSARLPVCYLVLIAHFLGTVTSYANQSKFWIPRKVTMTTESEFFFIYSFPVVLQAHSKAEKQVRFVFLQRIETSYKLIALDVSSKTLIFV